MAHAGGRPTDYTPELAASICAMLADGLSLRTVCLEPEMPEKATVFMWLRKHQEFADQYTRAKEQSTMAHFEDLLSIADEDVSEPIINEDGQPIMDGGGKPLKAITRLGIEHAKLRIDTRKWAMSKLLPKKYGDRTVLDATINDYSGMSSDERKRKLLELQQELQNAERG